MDIKKLVLGIHDLNPWGGQEKSNLEIFYRINQRIPIELHAYTFHDSRQWPQLTHVPYSQRFSRPSLVKFNHYHLQSYFHLNKNSQFFAQRKKSGTVYQSTGVALPLSDIVQVQFIQKAWYEIESHLPKKQQASESLLRSSYNFALKNFNLLHEKLLFTNSKKYIAISHSVKKDLMRLYNIKSENITVIYHGVSTDDLPDVHNDESQFVRRHIRHQYNIPDDAFVLLTVGALNVRKGLPIIFDVIKELLTHDFKSIVLLAVGAGDTQRFLLQAEDLGIASHIKLVPAQKEIAPFYQASDMFFFPSIYEPFGLVILEAMASGLPVVTSNVAGAAELITPNRDGIVIGSKFSILDIASEISTLIKDKSKRISLGRMARQSALHWHWDGVADLYSDFYKSY